MPTRGHGVPNGIRIKYGRSEAGLSIKQSPMQSCIPDGKAVFFAIFLE